MQNDGFGRIERGGGCAAQWAKIAEKVHKPPLRINIISFELNMGLMHGFLGLTQAPKSYNAFMEVHSTS